MGLAARAVHPDKCANHAIRQGNRSWLSRLKRMRVRHRHLVRPLWPEPADDLPPRHNGVVVTVFPERSVEPRRVDVAERVELGLVLQGLLPVLEELGASSRWSHILHLSIRAHEIATGKFLGFLVVFVSPEPSPGITDPRFDQAGIGKRGTLTRKGSEVQTLYRAPTKTPTKHEKSTGIVERNRDRSKSHATATGRNEVTEGSWGNRKTVANCRHEQNHHP